MNRTIKWTKHVEPKNLISDENRITVEERILDYINEIKTLYLDEFKSIVDISNRFGIHQTDLSLFLKKQGVKVQSLVNRICDKYTLDELRLPNPSNTAINLDVSVKTIIKCISKKKDDKQAANQAENQITECIPKNRAEEPTKKESITIDKIDEIKRLYIDEFRTISEIASRIGFHRHDLNKFMKENGKEHGIEIRPLVERICDKYTFAQLHSEKLLIVAEKLDVSMSTIRKCKLRKRTNKQN